VPATAALPWATGAADGAAKSPASRRAAAATGPDKTPATGARDAAAASDKPLPLEDVGLKPGDRVEVKWRVHPDEGPSYTRWWGARVAGPVAAQAAVAAADGGGAASATAALQYELVYDAHDGFEEERAVVTFLGPHRLGEAASKDDDEDEEEKEDGDDKREEDGDGGKGEERAAAPAAAEAAAAAPKQQQLLPWRREGDDYDEESDDEEEEGDEEGAAAGAGGGVVSVGELQRSGALLGEREALEAEAEALSGLPADQQRAVAAGFRDYIDTFKAFVRAKMAAQQAEAEAAAGGGGGAGPGDGGAGGAAAAGGGAPAGGDALTITEEMVAEFNAVVRNAKRARRDGGLPSVAPKP
jgi:hypothetical protein